MKKITEKRIYELLGVKIFRKYVLFTYEKICKKIGVEKHIGYRLEKNSIKEIKNYKKRAKGFAYAHIITLIITLIYSMILSLGIVYNTIFTVFNLYCIMVQRYNCIRIDETIKQYEKHNKIKQNQYLKNDKIESNRIKNEYTYKKEQLLKQKEELLEFSVLQNEKLNNEIENKPKVYSIGNNKLL